MLDGEHVGDDGVGAELGEGDGADDGLHGEDGAANQQPVRLLLAQRLQASVVVSISQHDRSIPLQLHPDRNRRKIGSWVGMAGHLKKRIPWAEQ